MDSELAATNRNGQVRFLVGSLLAKRTESASVAIDSQILSTYHALMAQRKRRLSPKQKSEGSSPSEGTEPGYSPNWDRVIDSAGYKAVHCPDHPNAWPKGYVYVHRIVMEMKLGRLLSRDEVVHHRDGDKHNNSPENLEVSSRSHHASNHGKERGTELVLLVCAHCGDSFQRRKGQEPAVKGTANAFCSRSCNGRHNGFLEKPSFKHGTSTGYSYHRCRCNLCKAAHREAHRKWRKSKVS